MDLAEESVSLSEWDAIDAIMSKVDALATPSSSSSSRSTSTTTQTSSFRPASSLPSAPSHSEPPPRPAFAASSPGGNRPFASRFQFSPSSSPSSSSSALPRPNAPGPARTTTHPSSSSSSSSHSFARQDGGARTTPPSPAASSRPQLPFTAASAAPPTRGAPGPPSTYAGAGRGAQAAVPASQHARTPAGGAQQPQQRRSFDNPYVKRDAEQEDAVAMSFSFPTAGANGAGGRSTHNRFGSKGGNSIFGSTDASCPSSTMDSFIPVVQEDDFESPPMPPQPSGRPGASPVMPAFAYPQPSGSSPRPYQQNGHVGQVRGHAPPPPTPIPKLQPPYLPANAPPIDIEFQLIEKDRFGTGDPAKRQPWLADWYAKVPGSAFDAENKMWTFPLSCYQSVIQIIQNTRGVTTQGLPEWIKKLFIYGERKPLNMSVNLEKLPVSLLNALYPFQREGVVFAIQRNGRALIADEMGLGKTMQAIAVAAYYKEDWPVLVVCPSSMRSSWAESFEKWIPWLRSDQIKVVMKTKDSPDAMVNIISYDLVVRQTDIAKNKFRFIIADESHNIKSNKAKRTVQLHPLLKDARRCLLLTGTPALSRPQELFTQLQALDSSVFQRMFDFGVRYCAAKHNHWGWDLTGSSNLKELNLLMQETVMIRRLKADVLGQLPAKKRRQVFIGIIDKHKKIIHDIGKRIKEHKKKIHLAFSDDAAKESRFQAWRLIKELYHDTGTAKLPAVTEYVKELLKTKKKILIFAHHIDIMDGVGCVLDREGIEYIRIDGHTAPGHRQELVDYFQTQPQCRAAVLGLTSAGVGLTMTKAEAIVIAELFWNPGILRQAEDRAHRIGLEHDVEVFYLVARGTLDESIWDMIKHKLDVLGNALNGEEEVLEAEEVEGKAPDGSTIDVFMEKILQKVETFDERERAYQERRLQQQRDAEMMHQLLLEDVDGTTEQDGNFQPALYFEAPADALEAAEKELGSSKKSGRNKSVSRGVTIGAGGKIKRSNASASRRSSTSAKSTSSSKRRREEPEEAPPEAEEEEPYYDDGGDFEPVQRGSQQKSNRRQRPEEVPEDDAEDEVEWPELQPTSVRSGAVLDSAVEEDQFFGDGQDDDDFEPSTTFSTRTNKSSRPLLLTPQSRSASVSSSPSQGNGIRPTKKRRIKQDDEVEEEEAEQAYDQQVALADGVDGPQASALGVSRRVPSTEATANSTGQEAIRAGQLKRFVFGGSRRLSHRD